MSNDNQDSPYTAPESEITESNSSGQDENNWSMFAHLAAFAGLLIPFGNIIGPLVVWLIKKDEMSMVDREGKEALNFQITASIVMTACALLMWLIIPIVIMVIYGIFWLVVVIMAAIAASNGNGYRYPMTLRLIK